MSGKVLLVFRDYDDRGDLEIFHFESDAQLVPSVGETLVLGHNGRNKEAFTIQDRRFVYNDNSVYVSLSSIVLYVTRVGEMRGLRPLQKGTTSG